MLLPVHIPHLFPFGALYHTHSYSPLFVTFRGYQHLAFIIQKTFDGYHDMRVGTYRTDKWLVKKMAFLVF